MNSTTWPSNSSEDVILPSAYSFGGFVQVRTASIVKTDEQMLPEQSEAILAPLCGVCPEPVVASEADL